MSLLHRHGSALFVALIAIAFIILCSIYYSHVNSAYSSPIVSVSIVTPDGRCQQNTYRVPPEYVAQAQSWIAANDPKPLEVRDVSC